MRIATLTAHQSSVNSLQERKRRLNEAQEHLDSQKRVLRASDDPVAAAQAERARARAALSESQQRAVNASRAAMNQADSALGNVTELLTQVRETLVGAGNGIHSDAERAVTAQQLQSLRDQLLALANSDDGAGNFLFGGQGSSTPPFTDGAAGVVFHGTAGSQTTATEGLPLSLDGQSAWLRAPDGNGFFKATNANSTTASSDGGRVTDPSTFFAQTAPTTTYQVQFSVVGGVTTYTVSKDGAAMGPAQTWTGSGSGAKSIEFDGMSLGIGGTPADGDTFDVRMSQPSQSIFDTLDRAIAELKTTGRTNAQVSQTLGDALTGLTASENALSGLRSRVGLALNRADAAEDRSADLKLQAEDQRSVAEDLDPVQAIADLQLQKTNYEMALQTYAAVQKLSLFNYIGG
ncbi:flagellar hook-associated protein FlgL [Azohydromonas caseinilytica]|uniref:Flagellar hook-associated protein FlgL n=1 Tax=Azohydromonas caseinilytica TaxID=2728836 RepID=A0A848F9A0_9BURK|nr:flagellar hook-associated protein FlgL [Azohydromonas caseinilytica]NML14913.1 flagellar hook-associated protein FlgL [Azohydromonas caseinilytica]